MDQPFGWDLFNPSIPRPDQEKDPLWISFLSSIALELPPPRAEGSSQIFPIMFHTTSDPGLNKGKIQRQIYADISPFLSHSYPISNPLHSRAENGPYPARSRANIRPKTGPFLSQSCPELIMGWKQTRIVPNIRPVPSWPGRGSFLAPYCADISPDLAQSSPGQTVGLEQTRIVSDIRPILSQSQPISGQIVGCSWHKIEPDHNLQMDKNICLRCPLAE